MILLQGRSHSKQQYHTERDDKREVDTIKWLYEVLRDEAHNVRGYLELLDKSLNRREAA